MMKILKLKKIILAILMALSALSALALPRYTVDYYTLDAEKYLDKEVTLRIVSANLIPVKSQKKEGYVMYCCRTSFKDEYGGVAYVYVPDKKAKTFYTNYSNGKSKIPVKAIMRKSGDKYYFEGH